MAEPDLSLLRHLLAESRAANNESAVGKVPLAPGGSGPHDPGMEPRVARLESDVGHIRSDISEIKSTLGRLAPRIDEMYGKLSYFASKEDIANVRTDIDKRPTRRQSVFDIVLIAGFIGTILTVGSKLAH